MQGEFNPQNPDDPRVQYISYTGRTCDALDFLDPKNDCQDLVDPLIGWSWTSSSIARGPNDGLVTVDSAKWGDYRGEMIADHIDEVGQILGITDPKFDHLEFYRARARELAADATMRPRRCTAPAIASTSSPPSSASASARAVTSPSRAS
jgi:hypothetical protein